MKASELMIGDLIIAPNGKPCKVVSIDTVDACVIDENKSIVPLCGEVIGVPLTAEILEKNGFWKGCYVGYFQHNSLNLLGIDIGGNINLSHFIGDHVLEVQYVHELQHVLKLAGLIDLADNFKI